MANLAINENDARNTYTSAGESVFAYTFPTKTTDDIKVAVDGVDLVYSTGFTFTGLGDASGGEVTIIAGTTSGDIVTIWLDLPIKRETGFTEGAAVLTAQALNDELAERTRVEQMLRSRVNRSIRLADTDPRSGSLFTIPAATGGIMYYVQDVNGGLALSDTGIDSTTPLTQALIESFLPVEDIPTILDYDAIGDGSTNNATVFAAIVSAGVDTVIVPPGSYVLSSTASYDLKLIFRGGIIVCDTNDVTIEQGYECGVTQCFSETNGGEISIGVPQDVRPEHFGTANTAVLRAIKASYAGSNILLQGKSYEIVPITINNDPLAADGADTGKVIRGVAAAQRYQTTGEFFGTRLVLADNQDDTMITVDSGGANTFSSGGITDVMLDGNKSNQTAGSGITLNDVKDWTMHNIYVWNCEENGIDFSGANNQVNMEGFIECWNNNNDGVRGAAMGDSQINGTVRCVNNGRFGFYCAAGGGKFNQIYAYFNGSHGIFFASTVTKQNYISYMRTEDNDEAGFRCEAQNLTINRLEAPDNGFTGSADGEISGVWLDGNCKNIVINELTAAVRVGSTHNQKFLLLDESNGGCVVRSIHNSAYGAHSVSGEQTIKFLNPDTLQSCKVGERMYLSDSYANVKDAGATITPLVDTYSRYAISALSETATINNTGASQATHGMTLELSILSDGSFSVAFDTDYLDASGSALASVALTVGQTAMISLVRRGDKWIAESDPVIV